MATPLNQNEWSKIDADTLVSMNMFGFSKKLMDRIAKEFEIFFAQPKEDLLKAEFLLPSVVNDMIYDNEVKMRVDMTKAKWYGITYKEDLEQFVQAIIDMKNKGMYPRHLY